MSGAIANAITANNPWLSTQELLAPREFAETQKRNDLLNQMSQQTLQSNDMEMIARGAAYLDSLPTTEARQAAYPGVVQTLQASGFAKNAPSVYPGDERIKALASMGTPSKELLTLNANRAYANATAPPNGLLPPPAPGTGTGTTASTYEGAIGGHEGTGKNPNSSAYGTGQFLESTWLNFAAEHPEMFPNMSQQQILAARSNPALGNTAINWLAQKNAQDLQAAGVTPSGQSLGISHYLGSGAAAKIMQAGDAEPVRNFVSEAAVRANPELANMTVGQMKARYAGTPNPSFMTASATPSGQGGGVAARTGGTDVAGPPGTVPAAPGATTAQTTQPQQPPAQQAPAAPGLLPLNSRNLTPADEQEFAALGQTGQLTPLQLNQQRQQRADHNLARQHNLAVEQRQAAADAATAAERVYQHNKDTAAALRQARLDEAKAKEDEQKAEAAIVENNLKKAQLANVTFQQENTLRDEFQKHTQDFRTVQTAFENITEAAKAKTGAGDMSMLYAFLHMIDPQTGIKESEYGGAAAAGSLRERLQGALERITTGGRLADSLRDQFLTEADKLYSTQLRGHNVLADQYETLAKNNGLNPANVVTRFVHPQEPKKPSGNLTTVIP